jgi:hypothetical protein
MSPDVSVALLLTTFLIVVLVQKQFSKTMLELLLRLTRPGATILLSGLAVWTYAKGMHYTFLILVVVTVLLLKDVWTTWPHSDARRLYLEEARDQARFDPTKSVDIQVANKTLRHARPSMLRKDVDASPLLMFPPTEDVLYELNGQ